MERVAKEAAEKPVKTIVCGNCDGLMVGYGEAGIACVRCGQIYRRDK